MRRTLLTYFLAALTSVAAAQGVCGDCTGDGQVNVVDALVAAQHWNWESHVPFLDQWRCDVNDSGYLDVIDALIIARAIVMLPVILDCRENPKRYALYITNDIVNPAAMFVDSFDSSAGPYAPTLPPGSPFSIPWQGNGGAVGTGGDLLLTSPANELHGPVHFGATATVAGLLEQAPTQPPQAPSFPHLSGVEWDWAMAHHDNDEINAAATLDPIYYMPGSGAYDPYTMDLTAWGPLTRVVLGDPGGQPKVYVLQQAGAAVGGTIEIVGPVTIYLGAYFYGDPADGVANLRSALPSTAVTILGVYSQLLALDCEPGFAATIYAPGVVISALNLPDFTGAIIAGYFENYGQLPIALHHDEALLR